MEFASWCEDPTSSTEGGVLQQRGFRCSPQRWQSDDPRFSGTGTVAYSSDAYAAGDTSYQVISSAFEVRHDAGGWHCTNADALLEGTSLSDASLQKFRMTCVGDGDYAGTTAILVVDFTNLSAPTQPFDGLAFPGEVPPFPATSPEQWHASGPHGREARPARAGLFWCRRWFAARGEVASGRLR